MHELPDDRSKHTWNMLRVWVAELEVPVRKMGVSA